MKDRKFEEWENSIEGIAYNLSVMGDVTYGDEHNTFLICQVLQKLPKRIRNKVLDRVLFVHTEVQGTTQPFMPKEPFRPEVMIVLNFKCVRSDKPKMTTIAHEIAHYILGHTDFEKISDQKTVPKNDERAADDLAEKWGFERAYKSYKRFERFEKKKAA